MNFLTILLIIALAISVFVIIMAVRKIKWQEKELLCKHTKIVLLQGQIEVQGKIDE